MDGQQAAASSGELHADDPRALGPYRITRRLGAGGMGRVYLARDATDRPAAVKVVHPALAADPQFRERFAREITVARSARGPWTAAVLDADPAAPLPWLATEYVDGPDLADAVAAAGPLPPDVLNVLALRLAQALAGLHAVGIVHRDLKPSNVLLAPDGPRLIDFGIARAADATRLTSTGQVIGTPAFMSPEQAMAEPTGPPSDVFSLASVLCLAATGRGPFGESSNPVAVLRRVISAAPELADVPEPLRGVLGGCLDKAPAQRPSAPELAARLAPLAGDGSAWRRPPRPGPDPLAVAPTPPRRRRPALIAVAVVAVLAVVGAATAVALNSGGGAPVAAPTSTPAAPVSTSPTSTTRPPPPSAVAVGLVPSRIPGWGVAISETRNVAYDVPPSWTPQTPGTAIGFGPPGSQTFPPTEPPTAVMSGVAQVENDPCPGEERPERSAVIGVTGSRTADLAQAATEIGALWSRSFQDNGEEPRSATAGAARTATAADGVTGQHVVTDVVPLETSACGVTRTQVHTVALPDDDQAVVWVLLIDRDRPGIPTDEEITQMISTIRRAGLDGQCNPDAVGAWC